MTYWIIACLSWIKQRSNVLLLQENWILIIIVLLDRYRCYHLGCDNSVEPKPVRTECMSQKYRNRSAILAKIYPRVFHWTHSHFTKVFNLPDSMQHFLIIKKNIKFMHLATKSATHSVSYYLSPLTGVVPLIFPASPKNRKATIWFENQWIYSKWRSLFINDG